MKKKKLLTISITLLTVISAIAYFFLKSKQLGPQDSIAGKPIKTSFVGRLRAKTGLIFDIPTEAQWEYACRAGTKTAYNNGKNCLTAARDQTPDVNLTPLGWYGANWPGEEAKVGTREVGLKQPNAWGLYDMHGNVWEYCRDWLEKYEKDATDPLGPAHGKKHVARGGSWYSWPASARSAFRMPGKDSYRACGFRLICIAPDSDNSPAYMTIDVSRGSDSTNYPIRYRQAPPPDILSNTDYKTKKIVLRRIPAGTFIMGSPDNELGRIKNETQHQVTLTKDFYIGIFEITQKQFEHVMGYNNSYYQGENIPQGVNNNTLPVEGVAWHDDIRGGFLPDTGNPFMVRIRAKTNLLFNLPTEAQWEYACRAGTKTSYNNGKNCSTDKKGRVSDPHLDPVAWYIGDWPGEEAKIGTREVGTKQPNAWGLYDMHGNVWENCRDLFGKYEGEAIDPQGPSQGKKHVARGGSWFAWPTFCRSALRMPAKDAYRACGFRLSCDSIDAAAANLYMIVDISSGMNGAVYPVTYRESPPEDLLKNDDYKTQKIVLRRIPAGTFIMGSPDNELGRMDREKQHQVTLTKDFYIGIFEITQKQFKIVMGYNPSYFQGDKIQKDANSDKLPVEIVSWKENICGRHKL